MTTFSASFDIEPRLPRRHKVPKRYDTGIAEGEFHYEPKAYYRQHYFEAIDLTRGKNFSVKMKYK